MRDKALKILQDETGSFQELSRLRDDVLDAMIVFKKCNIPSDEEIKQASLADYQQQKKYDNAYDRQKGFYSGVKWVLSVLK